MLINVNNSFSKPRYFLPSFIQIFLLFYCALLFFITPSINAGDAGELIAAAWHLGIPHPPGYPLYGLLAKAATFLPFGSIAYRVNLLSLLFAALVCAMFLPITRTIEGGYGNINNINTPFVLIASFLSALVFSVSPSFLNFLLVSEVYALNAFLFSLILLTGLKCYIGTFSLRTMFFTAFLSGLAIGNHHTIILMLPVALLFVPALKKMAGSGSLRSNVTIMISFFSLGLSIYFYLPIRSAQNPLFDWGDPQSLGLFLEVFYRRGYGGDPLFRSFSTLLQQLKSFNLLGEFGPVGLFLSACGFYSLWRCNRLVASVFALTFFFFSFLIIALSGNFKGNPEILKPFYIPAFIIIAIFISSGVLYVIKKSKYFISRKLSYLVLVFMVMLGLYTKTVATKAGDYFSGGFLPFDYAMNILKSIGSGSYYLANVDSKLFALWYLQMVEKYRDDVEVVPVDFLSQDWYSAQDDRRPVSLRRLDLIARGKVYAASLDETVLIPNVKAFSNGLAFRLGDNKEENDTGVWEYYTLRGLNSPVGMKNYEYRNILSDYASAYFNLGIDQYIDSKPEAASAAYRKSLKIRPDSPDVLNNLSLVYADRGINLTEAEVMAKDAIEGYSLREEKVNAIDTLGWVYYRMGRYEDALEMLDLCIDDLSEETFFRYHLGMTLFALKRHYEAETFLALATPLLGGEAREDAMLALGSIKSAL